MLPLSPGRDSVPWPPYPSQAPNLVSLSSRRAPFTLSATNFPRRVYRFPFADFQPRGSQDQSRPRSKFDAAPRALCFGYTGPCIYGYAEPPESLPSNSGFPTAQLSQVVLRRCDRLSDSWLRIGLTSTVSSRTPGAGLSLISDLRS